MACGGTDGEVRLAGIAESEEESLRARKPLLSLKQTNPDFTRRGRHTDASEVEEEDDSGVGLKMLQLSSEREGGALGSESRSPGRLLGRRSSPSDQSQRTSKSATTNKRKQSDDFPPATKERAQMLQDMAQSIYATFASRPLTPLGLRPGEDPLRRLEAVKTQQALQKTRSESQKPNVDAAKKISECVKVQTIKAEIEERKEETVLVEAGRSQTEQPTTEIETAKVCDSCAVPIHPASICTETVSVQTIEEANTASEFRISQEKLEQQLSLCSTSLKMLTSKVDSLTSTLETRERELEQARKEAKLRKDEADCCKRKEADMRILLSAMEARICALEVERKEQRLSLGELRKTVENFTVLQKENEELLRTLKTEREERKKASESVSFYYAQIAELKSAVECMQKQRSETPLRVCNNSVTPGPYRNHRKALCHDGISSPFSDTENGSDSHSQPLSCPKPMQEPVRFSAEDDQNEAECQRLVVERRKVCRIQLQAQLDSIPKTSRSLANKRRKLAIEFEISVINESLAALEEEKRRSGARSAVA